MNALALQTTVFDLVREYEDKIAALPQAIEAYKEANLKMGMASTIQGVYISDVVKPVYVYDRYIRLNLLKSGWKAIYNKLQIDRIATAKDRELFKRSLENPPPLTFENAKATFGDYFLRTRWHTLRGLAEVFCSLDPAYRSHSKVKIGVSGLPKRVIVDCVGSYGSYGLNRISDIINALATYRGQRPLDHAELKGLMDLTSFGEHRAGVIDFDGTHAVVKEDEPPFPNRGLTVKKFKNGNAHVFFDKDACRDINEALAEFYGEVLPDVEDDSVPKRESTAVSKDLQFYWTPKSVAENALDFAGIQKPSDYSRSYMAPRPHVLEPSCGDGRIMDVLKDYGCKVNGIEVDPARAAQARAKGHAVYCGNFLECLRPDDGCDFIIMNPPFAGKHYQKHIRHALGFLKPGGTLVSIVPASAYYDDNFEHDEWRDLPVASFADSGTNVPTGMIKIRKR